MDNKRSKVAKILRKLYNSDGTYWLSQNLDKPSEWTDLAKRGHSIFHLFSRSGRYAGKIKIDGRVYTYDEARSKFIKAE